MNDDHDDHAKHGGHTDNADNAGRDSRDGRDDRDSGVSRAGRDVPAGGLSGHRADAVRAAGSHEADAPDAPDASDVSDASDDSYDTALLEEELRRAAAVLDPVPAELRRIAVEAFALHDLDARIAELTFDSLVDAIPVRGVTDPPRMLTFRAGDLTVDVEVTGDGLMGQVLPPQPAGIEVLGGPHPAAPGTLAADELGRFSSEVPPSGPFALRLRAGGQVVVTEWLRA